MKHGLLLALLALTGCATIERHPVATSVITGVLVTSIALSIRGDHHSDQERLPDVSTPLVTCNGELCK